MKDTGFSNYPFEIELETYSKINKNIFYKGK